MVSVAHAEDSSSASANLQIAIRKLEWASTGIIKVYPEEGPSFFVRPDYLNEACAALVSSQGGDSCDLRLSEEDSAALYLAARTFLAERVAMDYLGRAEHSRYQLSLKLRKKGYLPAEIDPALDYLEVKHSLDDSRYAEAWLRNRSIRQHEGRLKMYAGLVSRGINGKIADKSLNDYFSNTDEIELCDKAIVKLLRTGKSGDKLENALIRRGFCRKTIVNCIKKL